MQQVIEERATLWGLAWAWLVGLYSGLALVAWRKRVHRVKAGKSHAAAGQFDG